MHFKSDFIHLIMILIWVSPSLQALVCLRDMVKPYFKAG